MIKHGDGMALVTDDDLRGLELQVRLTDKSTMWDCLDIREGLLNRIELQHGLLVERRDQGEEIDRLREGERAADAEIERLRAANALLRAECEAGRNYLALLLIQRAARSDADGFDDLPVLDKKVKREQKVYAKARAAVDKAGLLKEEKR